MIKSTRKKVSLPRFNLKDTKSKNPTLIYLIYRYKLNKDGTRIRFKYSTAKKVIPKFWTNGFAKESLHHPEYRELNIFLRELQNEVQRIVKKEPLIDPDGLKRRLDVFNGYADSNAYMIPTLPEYIDHFIIKSSNDARTIQKYEGVKKKLNKYCKERELKLSFDRVNIDFKNDFVEWLYENGCSSQNTVNKIMTTIVQFMKAAANEKITIDGELKRYHYNTDYLLKDFKVNRVDTSHHYLELEELDKLQKYDLSKKDTLKMVRDLFLVGCYTGLRISDLYNLKKHHFITEGDDMVIDIHTFKGRKTKADNQVVIPVLPQLKAILEEYDYQLPKAISEQKHNDYIKDICENAKINRKVIHKASIKGEIVESSIPVWSKVTNHTGRYTFINFMLNDYNVSPQKLMKITGQSLKVLMGYERGNKKKNALEVLKWIDPNRSSLRKVK